MLYRMVCSTALTLLIVLMSMGSFVEPLSEPAEITPLAEEPTVLDAPSPGHVVLAEYIGGQNCPPCPLVSGLQFGDCVLLNLETPFESVMS